MVMERVEAFPSIRTEKPVSNYADAVYESSRNRGPGHVYLALRHEKRTPLDLISRDLRERGKIRTMVAIDRSAGVKPNGQPLGFGLFAEWDENQEPYQSPPRKRRERSEG